MDIISKTNEFLKDVFDLNDDGHITFKEVMIGLAHHAPAILLFFVDLIVIVAEYRVYDAGIQMTHNAIKAFGFVLVSALPFYLGQLSWMYPRANFWQKTIAVLFVIGGLIGSAIFGRADLLLGLTITGSDQAVNPVFVSDLVIVLTASYIVLGLFYLLLDPEIRAWRLKTIMKAKSDQQKEFNKIIREILSDQQLTLAEKAKLDDEFGAENVTLVLDQLRSSKNNKKPDQNPTRRQG